MKLEETNLAVDPRRKFLRLLVPVDFTPASLGALRYAEILAGQFGSTIYLLHVVEEHPFAMTDPMPMLTKSAAETARDTTEQLSRLAGEELSPFLPVKPVVRQGQPAQEIIHAAKTLPADLIILAAHRRSALGRLLAGSTIERVARHVSCPVLVIHCPDEHELAPALWRDTDEIADTAQVARAA